MQLALHGPFELRAPARPTELLSRFNAVVPLACNGARIDATTLRMKVPMHLVSSDDQRRQIGVVESAEVRDGTVRLTGKLFSDIPGTEAAKVAELARRGSPFHVQLGVFAAQVDPMTGALMHAHVRMAVLDPLGSDDSGEVALFTGRKPKPQWPDAAKLYDRMNTAAKESV